MAQEHDAARRRDDSTQAPEGTSTKDYLETLVSQFSREVEFTGEMYLHEGFSGPDEPQRFEVRVIDPDNGGETVVNRPVSLDAGEMEAWLRAATSTACDRLHGVEVSR